MIHSIVGEDNFQKAVLEAERPVLVDFWATWCAPCLAAAPIMEKLSGEYDGKVDFAKINVEDNSTLAAKYGIAAIPTMIVFKKGLPARQIVGLRSRKDLKQILDDLVEK
ncbi:MAG: thioredoxin [Chloroflexota bacterium]|nr:thioredoxin [Chloroflexota bacterium]